MTRKRIANCQWCDGTLFMIKDAPFKYRAECSNSNCITNRLKRRKAFLATTNKENKDDPLC